MDDFDHFGLTSAPGDRRAVLAFARRWRRLQTDAARRQQIATDTHAPGAYRTDTVRHLAARHDHDVKPTDKRHLGPEPRARIWGADAR